MGALLLCGLVGALATEGSASSTTKAPNRYIGAAKCKSCHSAEATGDQYGHWMESGHAKAWEALASDEAKGFAKEKGIADAQKSADCVQCHSTAFGEPEDAIRKGFEPDKGVQCESCHGPGEAHLKARFAAAAGAGEEEGFGDEKPAYTPVPAGEIITAPPKETCLACHNEKSPTFKPFCLHERMAKIRHLNPEKPRTAEELAGLDACTCEESCTCKSEPGSPCAKASGEESAGK